MQNDNNATKIDWSKVGGVVAIVFVSLSMWLLLLCIWSNGFNMLTDNIRTAMLQTAGLFIVLGFVIGLGSSA